MPSIDEFLEFVDGRTQASELSIPREAERKYITSEKKTKTRTSCQIITERKWTACNEATHPLYACTSFLALSMDQRQAIVRRQGLCMNCLRHGYFASQCQSLQKCKSVMVSITHYCITTQAKLGEKHPREAVRTFRKRHQMKKSLATFQMGTEGAFNS